MHADAHNAMMRSSMMDRGDAGVCPDELANDMAQISWQIPETLQPPSGEELSGFLSFSGY